MKNGYWRVEDGDEDGDKSERIANAMMMTMMVVSTTITTTKMMKNYENDDDDRLNGCARRAPSPGLGALLGDGATCARRPSRGTWHAAT